MPGGGGGGGGGGDARTPLVTALRRQRHVDLCESEAKMVYRLSSRTATQRATQRNPV